MSSNVSRNVSFNVYNTSSIDTQDCEGATYVQMGQETNDLASELTSIDSSLKTLSRLNPKSEEEAQEATNAVIEVQNKLLECLKNHTNELDAGTLIYIQMQTNEARRLYEKFSSIVLVNAAKPHVNTSVVKFLSSLK